MIRQLRKGLLATVVGGSLVMLGGASGALAQGAKPHIMIPESDWAISPVAGANGAAGFCAIAQKFSDNMVLTIARNTNQEMSVAIDFQRPILDSAQRYAVSLNPGASESRTMEIKPVSDRAVVIHLGRDTDFKAALDWSRRLQVGIGGQAYEFSMLDMAAANRAVGGCLSSMIEPASGSSELTAEGIISAPATGSSRTMPAPQRLQQPMSGRSVSDSPVPRAPTSQAQAVEGGNIDAISREVDLLREENVTLRRALEDERRNFEAHRMASGEDTSRAIELGERVTLLERHNEDLRHQLARAKNTPPPSCPDTGTRNDEKAALESMQDEITALKAENEDLRIRTENLTAQIQQYASKPPAVSGNKDETLKRLHSRIDELENENRKLSQALTEVESTSPAEGMASVTLAQLRSVEAQLRAVEADRDRLHRQIDDMRTGKMDVLTDISSANWDLEQATKRYNQAERDIVLLQRQLTEERANCVREKREIEYMLFDPKISSQEQIARLIALEEELGQTQAALQGHESAIQTVEQSYIERLEKLDNQLQSKIAELDDAQGKLRDMDRRLAEARISIDERDVELAFLRSSKDEFGNELKSHVSEIQENLEHRSRLLSEAELALADRERHLKDLEYRLAAANRDRQQGSVSASGPSPELVERMRHERDRLHERLAYLEQEKQGLEKALAEKDTRVRNQIMAEAQQKIAERESRLKEMEQKLAAANSEIQNHKSVMASAPSPDFVDRVRSERDQLRERVTHLEQEMQGMEQALSGIQTASGPAGRDIVTPSPVSAPATSTPVPVVAEMIQPPRVPDIQRASLEEGIGNHRFVNAESIKHMIDQAGIRTSRDVHKIERVSGPDVVAFNWESGVLYGSATQRPMEGPGSYDRYISEYIQKTEGRCNGSFAAMPGFNSDGNVRVSTYEIACVADSGSATASLIFHAQDNIFTIYAHETSMDYMDEAMEARDRLARILEHQKVASIR